MPRLAGFKSSGQRVGEYSGGIAGYRADKVFFFWGGLYNCKYISVQNASEKVNEVECGELTARLVSVAVLSFVICDAPEMSWPRCIELEGD